MNSTSATSYQTLPLIGRILIAAIFLVSGLGKLTAPAATIGYIGSLGLPVPLLGYLGSMGLELVGSVLLIVRPPRPRERTPDVRSGSTRRGRCLVCSRGAARRR